MNHPAGLTCATGLARCGGHAEERLPLPAGRAADIWWFDVRDVRPGPAGLAVLSASEQDRADAFRFPADRHRYQAAHMMLRQVLARYTGIQPASLAFGRQPCPSCGGVGRPVLSPGAGAWFSLAHTADAVLIAVAGVPVGADSEWRPPGDCLCPLAAHLHPADAAGLDGLAENDRHEALLRWWVRAEAVGKCTGEGITHGLGRFAVTGPLAGACSLRSLAAPAGYHAALALAGEAGIGTVRVRGPWQAGRGPGRQARAGAPGRGPAGAWPPPGPGSPGAPGPAR